MVGRDGRDAGSSASPQDSSLAIVCPMKNEEDTAVAFVREMLKEAAGFAQVRFFAVLDRASSDDTLARLKALEHDEVRLSVVWAEDSRCVVDAYVSGYRAAIRSGSDWILEIDAGFSHRPRDLAGFLELVPQGFDCIYGSRFGAGGSMAEAPFHRRLISRGGTTIANLLLGTRLSDMTSGYQLFSRAALQQVLERGIASRGHFFQTEIKTYCRHMKVAEVPIHYRAPSSGLRAWVLVDAGRNLARLLGLRLLGRL